MTALAAPTFPASQALQFVTIAQRWGVAAEGVLEGTGLSAVDLAQPHARVSLATVTRVAENARALTGEPGLGFYLGLAKRATMYGYMGFAAMTAATVREAMEIAIRFTPAVTDALTISLVESGGEASLRIVEVADMGSIQDVASLSLVVGLVSLFQREFAEAPPYSVDFTMPQPPYFARFQHVLPNARFAQSVTQIVFPSSVLSLPLPTHDAAASRLAREQCERELAALGFDRTTMGRVRRVIGDGKRVGSVDDVARSLGLSARTLKRKLASEGTSFSELLGAARLRAATQLLEQSELSLEQIVSHVGYSSTPNFVRAFRRWTGRTPTDHRREHNRQS